MKKPWDFRVTRALGSRWALLLSCGGIVLWLLSGPVFGFSDTWQLIVNTATTVITFLMVFVLQRSQNRDTDAIHAKLDELLSGVPEADDTLRGIEREVRP